MLEKLFLIGPCGGGEIPKNGASAKNYHLVKYLKDKGFNLSVIDTEKWKKNPFVLVKLLFVILFFGKNKFILSADSMSSYRLIQLLNWLPKRDVIYWVIGGSVADWIKDGKVKSNPYKIVKWFLVEGNRMKSVLKECGFIDNVLVVPNFKNIDYIPQKKCHDGGGWVRFVFLSRIIPEKGCDVIFDAIERLNRRYQDKFSVSFYGPIDESYHKVFYEYMDRLANVSYKGFLDLRLAVNYDELANYDIMLFPTYWRGEGFPGVVIDAFVAGLPVIASDWSLNKDIIEQDVTGFIIPSKDSVALAGVMESIINNQSKINEMSEKCQSAAMDFSIDRVLNDQLLCEIGI